MRAVTLVRPKAVVRPDVTRRNTRRRVAVVTRASASSNENPSADAVATAKTWPTWGCEPSVFPWSYGAGEICLVIEGEATVGWCEARTEAGRLQVIVSGAVISYAAS